MDAAQMAKRCPSASLVGPALLRAFAFRINPRGVATIAPDESAYLYGVLWDVPERDLAGLDSYEGVSRGYYSRVRVTVERAAGTSVDAEVYIAADRAVGAPAESYMELIVRAARAHGLPESYLKELTRWVPTHV